MASDRRIERTILKYLNIFLGILMLVVLSLNIEQLLHNRRIFTPENYKVFKIDNRNTSERVFAQAVDDIELSILSKCKQCQDEALITLTRYNICGAVLSAFLSLFSFLMAYKIDWFKKRFNILVPGCILVCILTFGYFVKLVSCQIPNICVDSDLSKQNLGCDVDYDYNMDSKIIPLSVLMLVVVPQLLVRSLLRVIFRCRRNRVQHKPSSLVPSHLGWDFRRRPESNAHNQGQHSLQKMIVTVNPLSPESGMKVLLGDRELPVDCSDAPRQTNVLSFDTMLNNYWLISPASNHENDSDVNLTPVGRLSSRWQFGRPSLSTISEERTLTTNDDSQVPKSAQINVIGNLLSEIHTNSVLLNEILHVFKPSSCGGTFTRNVPIRFTSSQKLNHLAVKKDETSPVALPKSPPLDSSPSPTRSIPAFSQNNQALALFSSIGSSSCENLQLSPQRILLAKKMRLIKRLKNSIENKRGKKFNYLQQISNFGADWYKKSENVLFEAGSRSPNLDYHLPIRVEKCVNNSKIQLDTSVGSAFF